MSKSIIITKNGGPEVLELQDVNVGSPGPDEIKVTNYAIGLNYIDTYHRSGLYPVKLPSGIGLEAAGKIDEVGSNVTEFSKGDNIAYASVPLGAYAQQRIIPAKIAVKIPDGISHTQAATLMTKGLTTNYLLCKTYKLKAGETVLFHAAAGGVGQIFAQWANSIGAKVIGTVGSDEKINIANKFLLPKQIKDNGVKDKEMKLDDNIIKEIIRSYTKESGVRNLEREISKVARKVVKKVVAGEEKEVVINAKNLSDFLGVPKYKFGELESENRVGIVTGLAWTEYGGEILKIETATMPGKGRMQITGKLGDVMQESVKAAKSFVRSKCLEYGIIPPLFEKKDFHIHVPEGATPKDGPSAGVGMVTSIVSSITNIPVKRDVAMTGEVTLTGQVLPIGGLKEKLIAAHRAGIKEVLIPKENEKDLVDMPKKVIDEIKITPVEYADEVLKIALTKELKKTEWVEVDMTKKDDKSQASIQ